MASKSKISKIWKDKREEEEEETRYFKNTFPPPPPFKSGRESGCDCDLSIPSRLISSGYGTLINHYINKKNEDESENVSVYSGLSGFTFLTFKYFQYYSRHSRRYPPPPHSSSSFPLSNSQIRNQLIEPALKSRDLKRKMSFLCGSGGPLTAAIIYYYQIDPQPEKYWKYTQILIDSHRDFSDPPDELLNGRAGYLFALSELRTRQIVSPRDFDIDSTRQLIIDQILNSGRNLSRKLKSESPLMFKWHDKIYIGAAHGMVGILNTLLESRDLLSDKDFSDIFGTLDFIHSLKFNSGNYPSSLSNDRDRLVHWCHGAPGVIHLYLTAYRAKKRPMHLKWAEECAEIIWEKGLLKKGYGLCHGASGNGYAFLYLYQVTSKREYLWKANMFAKWCLRYFEDSETRPNVRTPDRPYSLYEGLSGLMYFLLDIQDPMNARMPGFNIHS